MKIQMRFHDGWKPIVEEAPWTDIYKCSFKVANYLWLVTLEIVTNGIQVLKSHSFINFGTINKICRQFFWIFDLLSSLDLLANIYQLLTPPHSPLPTYFMDGPHWGRLNHTNFPFAKGQLISKCLFGAFNSPKKRKKSIRLKVPCSKVEYFVRFLGESKISDL